MRTNLMNGFKKPHFKRTPIVGFILLILLVLSTANVANATEPCLPTMARVVSVQGTIELRRAEQTDWEPAVKNTALCAGDMIRTRSNSRAALRLGNESMLRLKQRTTVTFPKIQTDKSRTLLDLINGVIHIITRTPIPFKVRTPFVNATVNGTEFLVSVDEDSTRLVIYEGQVTASNDKGSLHLVDNEAAVTFKDQAPQKEVIIRPTDAVQWTLHYPTIIDDLLDPPSQDEQSANFLIHQAGHLLIVGRVDEATISIEQALVLEPDNSDAYALQAIIAVVQNDKDLALNFATQAVELDPTSATAKLALSYAQQAHFDIEDALATVHEAVKLDSQNALAWARLAELQMSVGYLDRALDAAQQAVRLNPDIAKTLTVLGFAYLLQINTEDAKTVFNEAILLDQADPMPRLGLGLALIREGELEAGRIELEIATSLDPANSLIRSYLGKAYFEEKRYPLAGTQFDLAKERDPYDPTPWFYDAIQKQTQNRPVEALQDIQKSIELNNNRAVYRSKLLLDQDQAGRGSSLARIYDNLGFEKRALMETAKSLSFDPSNSSAHRFLSDTYANTPRHEVARVSELLQAQLLQPINVNPVQPHLAVADLNIITNTGPASTGFNEFAPLMERNRLQMVASGIAGSNSTVGDEVVASALYDRASVSIGQYHFQSDGFRDNEKQNHNIYNAFMQYAVTPKLNIQTELRTRETDLGNLYTDTYFSELPDISNSERRNFKRKNARIGVNYQLAPQQNLIASAVYVDQDLKLVDVDSTIKQSGQGYQLESQYLMNTDDLNLIIGGGIYRVDINDNFEFNDEFFGSLSERSSSTRENNIAYLYSNYSFINNITTTLGISYNTYEINQESETTKDLDFKEINPKFGLQWDINHSLRLRLAFLETVTSNNTSRQTIEPTQVAGFNQFFDDINGTRAKRKGAGLDARLSNHIFGGIEASTRNLKVPLNQGKTFDQQKEKLFSAYLYGSISRNWSSRAEPQFEIFSRNVNAQASSSLPNRIETLRLPVSINFFNTNGIFASLIGTFVSQNVTRPDFDRPRDKLQKNSSDFFLLDFSMGYRVAKRKGLFRVDIKNILNKDFQYRVSQFQVVQPMTPRFTPSRTIFASLTYNF